jgi:hypothetical protein
MGLHYILDIEVCQTFIAKKPPQKCPENVGKCFKTPGKNLKRFDNYGKSLYNSVI